MDVVARLVKGDDGVRTGLKARRLGLHDRRGAIVFVTHQIGDTVGNQLAVGRTEHQHAVGALVVALGRDRRRTPRLQVDIDLAGRGLHRRRRPTQLEAVFGLERYLQILVRVGNGLRHHECCALDTEVVFLVTLGRLKRLAAALHRQIDVIETIELNAFGLILAHNRFKIAHVELNRARGRNLGKVLRLNLSDIPCARHLVARARQHHVIVTAERNAQGGCCLGESVRCKAAVIANRQRRGLPRLHECSRRALGKFARHLGRLAHPLKGVGGTRWVGRVHAIGDGIGNFLNHRRVARRVRRIGIDGLALAKRHRVIDAIDRHVVDVQTPLFELDVGIHDAQGHRIVVGGRAAGAAGNTCVVERLQIYCLYALGHNDFLTGQCGIEVSKRVRSDIFDAVANRHR